MSSKKRQNSKSQTRKASKKAKIPEEEELDIVEIMISDSPDVFKKKISKATRNNLRYLDEAIGNYWNYITDKQFNLFTLFESCENETQISSLVENAIFLKKIEIVGFGVGDAMANHTRRFTRESTLILNEYKIQHFGLLLSALKEFGLECIEVVQFLNSLPHRPFALTLLEDSMMDKILDIYDLGGPSFDLPGLVNTIDERNKVSSAFFNQLVRKNSKFFQGVVAQQDDKNVVGRFFSLLEMYITDLLFTEPMENASKMMLECLIYHTKGEFVDVNYSEILSLMEKFEFQDGYVYLAKTVSTKNVENYLILAMKHGFFNKSFQATRQTHIGDIIDAHVYRNPRFTTIIPFLVQFSTEKIGHGYVFTSAHERYAGIYNTNFCRSSDANEAIESIVYAVMKRDLKFHENIKDLYIAWMSQVIRSNHDIDVFALAIEFGFRYRDTKLFGTKFNCLLKVISELLVLQTSHLQLFWNLCKKNSVEEELFEEVWMGNQSFDSLAINYNEEDEEECVFFQMLNKLFPKLFPEE